MSQATDIHIHLRGQFGYQNLQVHTSNVLGTGSYGSVVKATLDHLPCAAKILHTIFFRSDDPGAADFAARFDQECAILREFKHPCIVQFLGVVQDPTNNRPILLMELMEESLTGFLERSATSLPYHVQVNITHDIALALVYLHGNNIIHRDLSSNNVLLNAGSRTKVTDFGMSKMVEANPRMTRSKITQCPGTPVFMPPEALRAKPRYSDKLDTFSLGVLMVQIITRIFPAPTDAERVREDPSSPTGEIIVPVPELERRKKDLDKVPTTHALLPIALHCLKDRDRERPTAAQLCQRLEQLKAAQAYTASEAENRRPSLEQAAEIARLQEQMRQLATEKEREVAELRGQLQTSQKTAPAQKKVVRSVSRPEDEKALFDAAKSGNISAVRRLIAAHVNIDCTPYQDGWTPLIRASCNGHVDIVRLLVDAKAQVNRQTEDGATPLYVASQNGHSEVVNILIRNGADINLALNTGETPLFVASEKGHSEVVNILIRNGADINLACNTGETPLFMASQKGHSEVVNILIRNGADINLARNTGATPLYIASQNGHSDIVNILIRNGADINLARNDGVTPLYIASQNGQSDVVNILIRNRADINMAWKGLKPIDAARCKGHSDIVRLLERRGH